MASKDAPRVGDYGITITATIVDQADAVVDVSGASSKSILLTDPAGNTSSHTASFTTDGTDGKIYYVLASGDLDEAGTWKYAGEVTLSGTEHYESSSCEFRVYPQLTA